MFDVGFLEILVVLIIALLVIGPERMPEVARKLGAFMGKTKRFIESVKQEGHLKETVDELKKSMNLQEEKQNLQNLEKDLMESMSQPIQEIDMETFSRPNFGGAEPVESTGGSQYSKAPAQPEVPSLDPVTPTEQPASGTESTAPSTGTEISPTPDTTTIDDSVVKPESKS